MRAVIYARYSSDKQTEQSIEGQLAVCQEYANRNNIEIVGEYIDRAISGRTDNRPDFQRMLSDSAKRQWEAVIVYKGDRFSRDRIASAINKKTLRENGVKLISATENIPDTPEGIILESLLEGMAEYYSAELSQKIKRGLEESRKKGQVVGGKRPVGYGVQDKKYIINEEHAETVRIIFKEYISGKSATEIEEGLKAAGRYHPNGKPFTRSMIYKLLHTEYYKGTPIYPAIITEETWGAAVRIHEAQKKKKTRVRSAPNFALVGKVYCGECGELYTAEQGRGRSREYFYYRCSSQKRKKRPCSSTTIRRETLETIVFDACCEVMEGGYIKKVIDRAVSIAESKTKEEATVERLSKTLREREEGIENIIKAIERGVYTPAIQTRLTELENEASEIRARIRAEKERKSTTREELTAFFARLLESKSDDDDFRAAVFNLLVRNVIIFADRIRITFNYTPDDGKDIDIKDEIKNAIEEGKRFDTRVEKTTKSDKIEPFAAFFTPFCFGFWVKR